MEVPVTIGKEITLPAPTRDGYTFDYWEGSKYNAGDTYVVKGDHTFKAIWKTADSGSGSGKGSKGSKTGDDQNVIGWISLMTASAIALAAVVIRRRDILHR